MNEDVRELIAADMCDESYQCPLCLHRVYYDDPECICSSWSEEEVLEFMKTADD